MTVADMMVWVHLYIAIFVVSEDALLVSVLRQNMSFPGSCVFCSLCHCTWVKFTVTVPAEASNNYHVQLPLFRGQ